MDDEYSPEDDTVTIPQDVYVDLLKAKAEVKELRRVCDTLMRVFLQQPVEEA